MPGAARRVRVSATGAGRVAGAGHGVESGVRYRARRVVVVARHARRVVVSGARGRVVVAGRRRVVVTATERGVGVLRRRQDRRASVASCCGLLVFLASCCVFSWLRTPLRHVVWEVGLDAR